MEIINASLVGDLKTIKELLSKYHYLDRVDPVDGNTALMNACEQGHVKIVELLLKNMANPNLQNKLGHTALMLIIKNTLIETDKVDSIVELLLKYGLPAIDIQNSFGNTALIYAADRGLNNVVNLLLKHGADITITNLGDKEAHFYCKCSKKVCDRLKTIPDYKQLKKSHIQIDIDVSSIKSCFDPIMQMDNDVTPFFSRKFRQYNYCV